MLRKLLPPAFLLATIACTLAASGEFRPTETSAKATWFAHLDIANLRDSEIGKELLNELDGEAKRQLRMVKRHIGFHPIDDLDSVTVYGISKDPEKSVALVRGKFNVEDLTQLAKDMENYEAKAHKASTIHSWEDSGNRLYGSIASDKLFIMSPELDLVMIAMDVIDGSAAGLEPDKIFGHADAIDSPFLIASADLTALGPLEIDSALVRKIDAVYISAGEKDGELLAFAALKTADGRSAKLVDQMFHGVLAFAEATGEIPQDVIEAFETKLNERGISMTAALPVKKFKALVAKLEGAAEGLK